MPVKTYYLSKGDVQLSEHFMLHEFKSGDNENKVLVSDELIDQLEQLFQKLNCTSIIVTSGFRTPSFSVSVGGYYNDRHTKGLSADVICRSAGGIINGQLVCCVAQDVGFNGIGYMGNAVHLDVDSRRWWGDETKGIDNIADFYSYFGITQNDINSAETGTAPEEAGIDEGDMENMTSEQLRYEVNRHALSLLGRSFSVEDIDAFSLEIENRRMSWYEFDKELQESEEGVKYWIKHALYIDILNRLPSQAELDWWYVQYVSHFELNKSLMFDGFNSGYKEFKDQYM